MLSSSTANNLLEWQWRNGSGLALGCRYLGLCTGDPGTGGSTANELDSTDDTVYTNRQGTLTWATPTYLSNGAKVICNGTQAWSPTNVGDTITHFILDASSSTPGTTHIFWQQLTYSYTTTTGVTFRFRDGRLNIKLTGNTYSQTRSDHILRELTNANGTFRAADSGNTMALSETVPNADGTNVTELSGSGYSRYTFGTLTSLFNNVTDATTYGLLGRAVPNLLNMTFGTATADWNAVSGWAIYNGSTFTAGGALDSTVTVRNGESPFFNQDEFVTALY